MYSSQSQALSGNRQDGKCVVPPADVKNADSFDYSVYVSDVNMVVEADPLNGVKCNVVDQTKQRAQKMVPGSDQVMNDLQTKLMQTMVVGETHNISTPNGVHITMGLLPVSSLLGRIEVGETGGAVTLPHSFCPFSNCSHDPALGFTVRQWPTNLFTFSGGANMLSPGTKIIEFSLHTRNLEEVQVDGLPPEHAVYVHIPKTAGANGNTTLPAMVSVDAINQSSRQIIPVIYTTFNVSVVSNTQLRVNFSVLLTTFLVSVLRRAIKLPKFMPQSTITLELAPDASNPRLFILIDKPRLPTLKSSMRFSLVNDLPVNNGTYTLFLLAKELAGLGRYFVGVGEFRKDFNMSLMDDPVTRNNVNMDVIKNISTNYKIRITVNGVAFLNKTTMKWETGGLEIINATETLTTCTTNHLTSFGASMFVMPNTVDFNYVFAHMGFTDNLTIYLTLIICLSIFVILLIWARIYDKKDLEKLGAAPLPDNKVEDKYLYEIAVFTGNIKGAQTDSVVQFILSGEHDETDVRTIGDDRRKILRKGDVDIFVMTVPRPLGALQLLRVWHDNSGKGVNASWFLNCIIITDVQTETKYHFIADQWFAVESYDGQVERLLPVAGEEEKKKFKFLMETNANSRLTDEHLWFSVFLRPKRSRFTRCQRVACCFGVLFLKMLVEAMWYEREPEKPSPGSLSLGPFNLSPEVVGIGLMSNLIVFPPTILMVLFFRKARPRRLRRSRITLALERTRLSKSQNSESCSRSSDAAHHPPHSPPHSSDSPLQSGELSHESRHSNEPEKSEEKIEKSITLPWWFMLIAWALAVVCISVSCFFLLMYGITFGNEKTTKWISALIISFFTEILLQEPIKIIVIAMVMSAICKTSDLEEDDSEEDQEEPQLERDEDWLHPGNESTHSRKHKRLDDETLERLRKERQQEIDMWKIMTEIVAYSIFLWVFLTITYGSSVTQ
nr:polycystic kidney disease protein 1-like 2 [Procambarus clarkii]